MTGEATLVVETQLPIAMTVSNTTGIEKGTLLTLSDPITAAATTARNACVAGIAASEKIASDGNIRLGVYRGGIFRVTGSGSITVGDPVVTSAGGVNEVETAATNDEHILGYALESSTDAQTLLIELRPTTMQLA